MARLIPRKGFKYLLQALANLKDKKWKWVAVGSGPLQEPLMQQARELGIEDRVHTLGFVDEETKLKALASADVFVLPSLHEGFGVVNLEAMACGLSHCCHQCWGSDRFSGA